MKEWINDITASTKETPDVDYLILKEFRASKCESWSDFYQAVCIGIALARKYPEIE